ncbi:ATP-dependent helicase [Actinomyces vulturis]|uniref:ATP-dependent helicase n=1 Tax=Actinomyces vulturis TaxID=1857645 RepID=UPI000AC4AFCA|nr:UvrD-helicase domain-containing protein [Actinomyces vulturis]
MNTFSQPSAPYSSSVGSDSQSVSAHSLLTGVSSIADDGWFDAMMAQVGQAEPADDPYAAVESIPGDMYDAFIDPAAGGSGGGDDLFANFGGTAAKIDGAPAQIPETFEARVPQGEGEWQSSGRFSAAIINTWDHEPLDPEALLEGLNEAQHAAVVHHGAPLLIIAGAGSGKTRVLTHRIAFLLATGRAHSSQILAITFTNKAAAEMRERVAALVGHAQAKNMWVFTFHSACVRILRREYQAAGLRSTFSIYDAQDSSRLITLVVKELGIDHKRFSPKTFARRISDLKNELITPEEFAETAQTANPVERHCVEVYRLYQQRLEQANALDFDDIIMRTVQLLRRHPDIAEMYQRRFRHILVDEYQDTNHAQYVLVRELVGAAPAGVANSWDSTAGGAAGSQASGVGSGKLPMGELTVVGDSDQSIYAFRGATIRNIEEFEQDYPQARTIVLEQNYRSTQNILSAANAVISRNGGRRPKNLWTDSGDGEQIVGYVADSDRDEARWINTEIDRLIDEHGVTPGDVAIFYRTNAQSRALEEALIMAGQPYRVVGGTRFYERKEIKDALAYLRAIDNPDDAVSLRRILNTPKRGIGDKAEEALVNHAAAYNISFGQALEDCFTDEREVVGITAAAKKKIANFWDMLVRLRTMRDEGESVAGILDTVLDESGYVASLQASDDPQDATRVENLAELHSVAADFNATAPDATLMDFLERVSLVADSDQLPPSKPQIVGSGQGSAAAGFPVGDEAESAGTDGAQASGQSQQAMIAQEAAEARAQGQITLMTVHTAKGLEFPVVFVTGMEDGTFPHSRSMSDEQEMAEERRLAYVALTRARERLYVTRAAVRNLYGAPNSMGASRFLSDIPKETMRWEREFSAMDSYRGYDDSIDNDGWGNYSGATSRSNRGYGSGGSYGSGGNRRSHDDDDFGTPIGGGHRSGKPTKLGDKNTSVPKKLGVKRDNGAGPTIGQGKNAVALHIGDRIKHETYGQGTVVDLEGSGASTISKIQFDDGSVKRIMLRYAPVSKVS